MLSLLAYGFILVSLVVYAVFIAVLVAWFMGNFKK